LLIEIHGISDVDTMTAELFALRDFMESMNV